MRTEFKALGMTCGHCTSSVEAALKKLPNVSKVEVDLESKNVVVEGESLDKELIKNTIEDIGFDVEGL